MKGDTMALERKHGDSFNILLLWWKVTGNNSFNTLMLWWKGTGLAMVLRGDMKGNHSFNTLVLWWRATQK